MVSVPVRPVTGAPQTGPMGAFMHIGEFRRELVVEPVETPVPEPVSIPEPTPVETPEPVPVGVPS